jgi:O-antigen/teichoic acid export membrane protein
LDVAVLGLFVSSGLIDIYSVAWSITVFLTIFGNALEDAHFPEMSKTAAGRSPKAVCGLTEK